MDSPASPAPKDTDAARTRRGRIATVAIVAVIGVPTALSIVFGLPAALPFDLEALAVAHPAVEDRDGRRPIPGCGLAQLRRQGTCVDPSVTRVTDIAVRFASRLEGKGRPVLEGTLSVPEWDGAGRRPAVVLIHGSGPNSRDEPSPGDLITRLSPPFPVFKALAEHLVQRGFVVLRYDKRSCSACYGSNTDFAQFEFTDFVADAQDANDFLSTRPEVDPNAIVVMGHSQGGQLAPFIARGDERVAAVALLAAPLDNFEDGALGQLQRVADIRRSQGDYLGAWSVEWLHAGPLETCFDKLRTPGYDPAEYCIGGGVSQGALARYIALGDGTSEALRTLDIPIFVVQGSLDRNIDPTDLTDMQRALAGKDAEFHYLHGVNHALTNSLAPTEPTSLDPELLARLDRFLDTVGRR